MKQTVNLPLAAVIGTTKLVPTHLVKALQLICRWGTICELDTITWYLNDLQSGLILDLRPADERLRYNVTPSLIGRAQT